MQLAAPRPESTYSPSTVPRLQLVGAFEMTSLRSLLNPESPSQQSKCPPQRSGKASSPLVASSPSESRGSSPDTQSAETLAFQAESTSHPPHENCPDSLDCLPDTEGRPQHTLPVILRCTILGSAKRRLTIRDIYAAMEKKYPYYRTAGPAWKQSVRHHLSLNRLFERQAKPVTEPGFGSYWTVNLDAPPGTKRPRKRGRQSKNIPASTCDPEPIRRGRPKKCPKEGFEYGSNNLASASIYAGNHSSQQFRLHSVQHLSAVHNQDDDDEMYDTLDPQEPFRSITSDDAGDSDEEPPEDRPVWVPNLDHRPYPPSPRLLGDFNYIQGANEPTPSVERLREEIRELQRQVMVSSAVTERMANELSDAHAEIARLRLQNELIERGMGADTGQRYI
ncbi:hypothetical protein M0805_003767 [Coniferiporia weirii]|nr:hypothetical protein M0805_003767 [Coniferiporia weirii]